MRDCTHLLRVLPGGGIYCGSHANTVSPGVCKACDRFAPSTAERCGNCHGPHKTADCTIPPAYEPDNWRLDSAGNAGCGCK